MAAIDNQFLVPAAGEKELIVVTDSQGSASFLIAKADTMVLSSPATELLKKAYLTPTPPKLKNVAGAAITDQISKLRRKRLPTAEGDRGT